MLGSTGVVGLGTALVLGRRALARRKHPQDYAFAVCTAFGPELGKPREERVRRVFPDLPSATLSRWLEEFEAVDSEIWSLARAGGPTVLGDASVSQSLRTKFPFLVGPGLRQATFLVWHSAWHEGYDKAPERADSPR